MASNVGVQTATGVAASYDHAPHPPSFVPLRRRRPVKIWVVNNGSQWTHRQWRVLRYLKQETQIVDNTTPAEELKAANLDGLLLSGGAARVGLDGKLGAVGDYLDQLDIPILGVCAGHQFMGRHFGGQAAPGERPEFGMVEMTIQEPGEILDGIASPTIVWASHHDEVSILPPDFKVLASSVDCPIQVMRHNTRPLFGMSYHPEVEHTRDGVTMFRNFVRICENHRKTKSA